MIAFTPKINLAFAWLWITLGFISGFILGLKFDREEWHGGYASWKRRLMRLGHISFFGLAIVNALFAFTVNTNLSGHAVATEVASLGFILGGIFMPTCCFITASNPKLKPFFLIPVVCLIMAGIITLLQVMKSSI